MHGFMTQKVLVERRRRLRASFCSAKLHSPQEADTDGAPIGNLRQLKIQ
jgi:hypothetical protein